VSGGAAPAPALTVVVPSYNRRASLEMVLGGLAAQRGLPDGAAEVLVVLDGSTDDSAEMLAAWERAGRLPGLRWARQPNAGQAAARDAGARGAAAPVLVFLDDDVVPEPDCLAGHLAWHARGARIAVLGDCEIVRAETDPPFYRQFVWGWWEELYSSRVRPGRVPCYTDFCAGNVSLRRDDYLASGGFDPAFRGYGGEDYDLGYRLLRRGVRFVPDRRVRAMHHHRFSSYRSVVRTRRQEGAADVVLGRKHPELRAGLRLAAPHALTPPFDAVPRAAFAGREPSPLAMRAQIARLELAERLGQRTKWLDRFYRLAHAEYWRGVAGALGSWEALVAFRDETVVPVQEVDVMQGVGGLRSDFWVDGPSELRVTAAGEPLGTARLNGPVTKPLPAAIAEAVGGRLLAPLLLWADRADVPVLTPRAGR
jgi:GT2 family glycosyltransferase